MLNTISIHEPSGNVIIAIISPILLHLCLLTKQSIIQSASSDKKKRIQKEFENYNVMHLHLKKHCALLTYIFIFTLS